MGGFYKEEDGKHYGPIGSIKDKLGVPRSLVEARIKQSQKIPEREVRDTNNRQQKAYAFEDVKNAVDEYTSVPQAQKTGEWKGFYQHEDGKHYGSIKAITARLDVSENLLRDRIQKSDDINRMEVRGVQNQKWSGFPLEDVRSIVEEHLSLPQAKESGEWEGFYEGEDGKHYGPIGAIKSKLDVGRNFIESRIQESDHITEMEIRDRSSQQVTAYPFEDVKNVVNERMSIPQVDKTGKWEGFYETEEGKHYGPVTLTAKNLDVSTNTIYRYNDRYNDEISTIKILDSKNRKTTGYCLEDLQDFLE